MGVLDTLAQMSMAQRERNMLASQNIGQNLSKQNAIMLGQKFARQADFSVQGIAKFMSENQLDENSMGTIIKMVQAVSQLQGETKNAPGIGLFNTASGQVTTPAPPEADFASSPLGIFSKTTGDVTTPVPEKPKGFASSPLGIFNQGTGEVVAAAPDKPSTSPWQQYFKNNPNAGNDQVLDFAQKLKEKTASEKSNTVSDFTEDELNFLADDYRQTKQMPTLGMGAADLRAEILKRAAKREMAAGGSATTLIQNAAGNKALTGSIVNQEKQRGMMGSFVKNINKQVDRVDQVSQDLVKRVGARALDLPIRSLKRSFVGSGNENIIEAYTIEISNEIGKLSTGSSASVAELSTGAQEQWAKIHDPNLSFKELKKILDETRDMANMRLDSTKEQIAETVSQIGTRGNAGALKAGAVEDGYRFKGGDPADPNAWEKVQ